MFDIVVHHGVERKGIRYVLGASGFQEIPGLFEFFMVGAENYGNGVCRRFENIVDSCSESSAYIGEVPVSVDSGKNPDTIYNQDIAAVYFILDIFKKRALLRTVFCSGGIFFVEPRKAQGIVIPELFLYLLYAIALCFMRDDDELYLLEILQDFCNYLFIWFPCASGNKSEIAGCEFFYYGEIFAFADYLANPVETGISAYLYVFTYSYRGQ